MAKQLLNAFDGALIVEEENGVVTLSVSKDASIGGGEAAGLLKIEGSAKVVLDGQTGLKLAESLLNAHLPEKLQPLAQVVEGVVNQAIAAIE